MKEQFISSLKEGHIPASEAEKQLEQVVQTNLFEAFNADIVSIEEYDHRWSSAYFFEKMTDLEKFNFSEKLARHLIDVKKYLQEPGRDAQFQIKPMEVENTASPLKEPFKETLGSSKITSQAGSFKEKFAKIDLAGFKPNARLLNSLAGKDISKIRTDLMSLLNNRRLSLEEVAKSIWYVWQEKPEVFVEEKEDHFVKAMDNNEVSWNNDYFNQQQVYLNRNFSLARILHLVNVRENLMQRGDKNFQQIKVETPRANNATNASNSTNNTQQASSTQSTKHQYTANTQGSSKGGTRGISTLVLVGGAVLALFATLFAIFK
ncbi:hypothetical protein [Pasteurella sp. PK-2025]|uniref:hypothetical protein n=1 Tax=Pasteurella sp. PK-2025 TaxID=3413133 RepID=UPI003C7638B9